MKSQHDIPMIMSRRRNSNWSASFWTTTTTATGERQFIFLNGCRKGSPKSPLQSKSITLTTQNNRSYWYSTLLLFYRGEFESALTCDWRPFQEDHSGRRNGPNSIIISGDNCKILYEPPILSVHFAEGEDDLILNWRRWWYKAVGNRLFFTSK